MTALALAILWSALAAAPIARQEPPGQEPEAGLSLALRVNRAIARGVEHLQGHQRADGSWPGHEQTHPGGVTALVAYTLVKSGLRRSDAGLHKALARVESTSFRSTYSHSVRLMLAESLAEPARWRAPAEQGLAFLVDAQRQGVWGYPADPLDLSNTQFALLGLRSAHRLGLAVPDETLRDAAAALWRWQTEGGFRYREDQPDRAGMTAATLGGLAILEELGSSAVRGQLKKKKRDHQAAWERLEARFDVTRNASGPRAWTPSFHYAYMWAVERMYGLTGRADFEGHDWYTQGAEWLVDDQRPDGGWGRSLEDVCFALLFLRRATVSTQGELEELYAEIDRAKAAAHEPEPTPEPGLPRLVDWLIAGPWQGDAGNGILVDPPFDPTRVKLAERVKVARRAFERQALKPDGWTDLSEVTGTQAGDSQLWLVGCWLEVDEPAELFLWLDLEDGWDVYLDGLRLSFSQRVAAPIDGSVRVPLGLEPGRHALCILVEDDFGAAAFGARLTDPRGRAPPATVRASAVPARR